MRTLSCLGIGAALALATAAYAQPAAFTNLGSHNAATETFTQEVTLLGPTDIQWFKVVLPSAPALSSGYVDLWTVSGGANPMTDTEIGIYDNSGNLIANDDDSGVGLYSVLTFGIGSGQLLGDTYNLGGDGIANGENGPLAGGTYWVAVGRYNVTFTSGWGATSTYAGTETTTTLNFAVSPPTAPYPPSVTAAATPASTQPGQSVLFTGTVSPGGNPTSTGLVTRIDLSTAGGSATQLMYDDGTHGDATAGDHIYSFQYTIPNAQGGGQLTLPVTVTDAQSRSGTANAGLYVGAPPATFTSLGNISCTPTDSSTTINNAGEIQWFRVTLPAVTAGAGTGGYVDLWTLSTSGVNDTEMGLYDSNGNMIASDDDSGNGLKSQLSFGDTGPRANPDSAETALAGQNGSLSGGVYWLAVGVYNVTFNAAGWQVTSTGAGTGTIDIHINAIDPGTCNIAPHGLGAATPDPLAPAVNGVFAVTVTPGVNPASTGLNVHIDLSAVGGAANQVMYDDGTHGDAGAGDNVFTYTHLIPAGQPDGAITAAFTVADAQGRSTTGTIAATVSAPAQWDETLNGGGDAGDLPNSAQVPNGSGPLNDIGGHLEAGDVDMYQIQICDPGNFSASLANDHSLGLDTQLFLFDANGAGIVMDDDDPSGTGGLRSALSNAFTAGLPSGNYYLAVSGYDTDPLNASAAAIWEDTPFGAERAPDGLNNGGDITVTGWDVDTFSDVGEYRISFTGVCYAGASSNCLADFDDGSGTGHQDGAVTIDDLLYYLGLYENGQVRADVDNGTFTGTQDGAVTIDDLLYFLFHYENGC